MLVMELCTGGDMYARIPYTEHQVAVAIRQVLSAVKYMHANHFIHRDVSVTAYSLCGVDDLCMLKTYWTICLADQNGKHPLGKPSSGCRNQID